MNFGCCVGSWEKFTRYVVPFIAGRPTITVAGATSITPVYNLILEIADPSEPLCLLHDDLEVTDPVAERKIMEALEDPDVAIVGVCGGSARNGLAWWSADPIGHQMIDTGLIDFGRRTGDVDSLEGSFMVFSSWAIEHLRFDESFHGFHGYDHIGMIAREAGKRVVVVDVDTHHHTRAGFKSPESERAWVYADDMFRRKWL